MQIKTARHAAGLTLMQLSEITGINIRQIQKYERNECSTGNMTLKNAVALANALGVRPEEFLEGE